MGCTFYRSAGLNGRRAGVVLTWGSWEQASVLKFFCYCTVCSTAAPSKHACVLTNFAQLEIGPHA